MSELQKTIDEYGLEIPEAAVPRLEKYCQLLWEINETLNLTRHTDYQKFVSRDLVDTLELSRLIPEGKEVLDLGSGGGVPGMVLAILRPDLRVILTDSVGKKTLALDQIAEGLDMEIEIFHCRAEDLLEDMRVDYTTARAVGPLIKICRWLENSWLHAGRVLAIKGPRWPEEQAAAKEAKMLKKIKLEKVAEYPTPGTEWSSVILELRSKSIP